MTFALPHTKPVFKHQPDATLDQADPVQNTWYTIIDEKNCQIIGISVTVLVADETLEVQFIVDGVTIPGAGSPVTAGTTMYVYLLVSTPTQAKILLSSTSAYGSYNAFIIEGRSVKVQIRKTTAAGNGNLQGCVAWNKME